MVLNPFAHVLRQVLRLTNVARTSSKSSRVMKRSKLKELEKKNFDSF